MKCCFLWLLFALALVLSPLNSSGAVTLTMTPSATSNTYTGSITLAIAGLTNGQPVTVETYLDMNGNGVVDASEPLLDTFPITDGGASVIGGITNISVPFDRNSAAGAITTKLNFSPPFENVAAQKIYRVLGNPLKIDGKRPEQVAAPALGADNDALLGQTQRALRPTAD